jgi:alkanesulfonate monooxygenase SsuD/methylene tetrahydromethanopterin reductase-like flavin-dependent oxidoreductase (luciferase family)
MMGCGGTRMMHLTARYADLWNSGYFGHPDTFVKPRQEFLDACRDEGRDPASIGITAMVYVHYPKMMPVPEDLDYPPITGTPTQVAKAMLGYQQMGVEHIMIHVLPYKPAAIRKLEQALPLYHQLSDEKGRKKAS